MIIPSTKFEGFLFPFPLESDSCERMVRSEILGSHRDEEGTVGYSTVLSVLAHPINTESTILRGSGDDVSARTHTKRIDTPRIRRMCDEFVARGPEFGIDTRISELGPIDHIGIVFYTDPHSKWFRHHCESLGIDHLVGIASRMPYREDERIGFDSFIPIHDNCLEFLVYYLQIRQARFESDLGSERDEFESEIFDQDPEFVGSDVRLGHVGDLSRGSCLDEFLEDILRSWIIDHRVELAVTECPSASFSEEYIGIGIEFPLSHQYLHILDSLIYHFAPLYDDGSESGPGESESGK